MSKNQNKKIMLLTDCFPGIQSGAERQIYELARRLEKNRYRSIVSSLESVGSAPSAVIEAVGAELVTFPVKRVYGLSGIREGFRFFGFLRKEKVDILITYHFSSDIWGTFWGHMAGVKTIISNRRDMGFWRGKQHIWAYRLINRWVNKIVVVAQAVKDVVMREEAVPEAKIEVVYNGINLEEEANSGEESGRSRVSLRHSLSIKDDEIVVICVGTLWPVKGHRYLLEAVSNLKSQISNFKLVLVGDGELRSQLADRVQRLAISDKVMFLGKRSDARQLLQIADICVLPSLSEGMSNAILEYMAAGKPVIATRVGGNPELVVDGQTGILVEAKNVEQLAGAVMRLITNAEERRAMGERGRARVQSEFSMDKMVAQYEKVFGSSI